MPLGWGIRLGRRLLDLGRARSAEFAARELAPACWIKAIDRLDDPDRPDLHEVIEWLSPVRVPARKRANERHVVEDEPLTLGRVERSWLRCHAAGGRSFQGWGRSSSSTRPGWAPSSRSARRPTGSAPSCACVPAGHPAAARAHVPRRALRLRRPPGRGHRSAASPPQRGAGARLSRCQMSSAANVAGSVSAISEKRDRSPTRSSSRVTAMEG